MIPVEIKSLNHPSHKKYRVPSISAHHFPTWVQADWSSIFLSFWTLFLPYWCGFSESAWKRTRYWIQPDISMHILHTGIYTFSKVLTRRICLIIKSFIIGDHFLDSWFRADIRVQTFNYNCKFIRGKINFKKQITYLIFGGRGSSSESNRDVRLI